MSVTTSFPESYQNDHFTTGLDIESDLISSAHSHKSLLQLALNLDELRCTVPVTSCPHETPSTVETSGRNGPPADTRLLVTRWGSTYITQLIPFHAIRLIIVFLCDCTLRAFFRLLSKFSGVSGQQWKGSCPIR
jgi:hypothetical protein